MITNKFTQFLLLFLLMLIGCNPVLPPTPEEAYQNNLDYLKKQAFKYWDKRSSKNDAVMATFFMEKAHLLEPENLGLALRLSRAYHFQAYYIETDQNQKDSLFTHGATISMNVIKQSPAFKQVYNDVNGDSMTKMIQSVAAVEKEYIDALYWWAANMGRYLSSKSVRERLDYRDLAESVIHRVLSLNPDYFYGGPYRYFGAFYARIPGVELKRSEEYFNKAIKSHPNYLGTYVLRARFLHTKAGDRDKFKQDLDYVINADPALIPEVMPENLYEQKLAQMLLEQEDLLFK
ncbi:MAG: hypothetical protein IIB95_11070 [Candidatus Marinimicrobia bacterium]|nr:hypothetical protein [Candidatus Neomarinimicrobiota bacterium]